MPHATAPSKAQGDSNGIGIEVFRNADYSSDRGGRSKLVSWMKRLTKSKGGSKKQNDDPSPSRANGTTERQDQESQYTSQADGEHFANGNESAFPQAAQQVDGSFLSLPTNGSEFSAAHAGNRSLAPTDHTAGIDCAASDADGYSRAATSQTLTGGGGDSTFSSTHSAHSLNTTLTTIQSTPSTNQVPNIAHPSNHTTNSAAYAGAHHSSHPSAGSNYYNEYPTSPALAIPPHLNPNNHVPTTYRSATAHNLLSDNASVLTLASSSHRPQRRNSLDTNASIRAIAPSSVWGGSRESLPLSVLSQSADREGPASAASPTPPSTAGVLSPSSGTRSASGLSRDDRGSLYTSVGAPALTSERNSLYTGKSPASPVGKDDSASMHERSSLHDRLSLKAASVNGEKIADGAPKSAGPSSVSSGLLGHGRNDSTTGSIGGVSSPLAGPAESTSGDADAEDAR